MGRQRRPYMANRSIEKVSDADRKPKSRAKSAHSSSRQNGESYETRMDIHTTGPGRPTIFSMEIAESICDRLSRPESMRSICRDSSMPGRSTIASWMATNDVFRAMIIHARELQADALADEMLEIADDATGDYEVKDGKVIQNWESVQRAKLRCDARRWYAAKLAPKRYSERVALDDKPDRPMMPKELEAALADLLDKAERDIGLHPKEGASNADRFTAILNSGHPVPPDLYRAMHSMKVGEHGYQ